jgi:hypothetical protein
MTPFCAGVRFRSRRKMTVNKPSVTVSPGRAHRRGNRKISDNKISRQAYSWHLRRNILRAPRIAPASGARCIWRAARFMYPESAARQNIKTRGGNHHGACNGWRRYAPGPAQNCSRPRDSRPVSAKERSASDGGQPSIARNTSKTNSPIAMSLKSVAEGRFGQNWLAAQKRNAAASMAALANSGIAGQCVS